MAEPLTVWINGVSMTVAQGSMVSAALLSSGQACRVSVTGEPRTALCGMGICFECQAIVNGVAHMRTCQLIAQDGMKVETQR